MALTPKNWSLSSYTDDTWTEVVGETAVVATVLLTNTTGAAITVELRLAAGASELSRIVPATSIEANTSKVLDVRSLNLTSGQSLELKASATGIHALASGVVTESAPGAAREVRVAQLIGNVDFLYNSPVGAAGNRYIAAQDCQLHGFSVVLGNYADNPVNFTGAAYIHVGDTYQVASVSLTAAISSPNYIDYQLMAFTFSTPVAISAGQHFSVVLHNDPLELVREVNISWTASYSTGVIYPSDLVDCIASIEAELAPQGIGDEVASVTSVDNRAVLQLIMSVEA